MRRSRINVCFFFFVHVCVISFVSIDRIQHPFSVSDLFKVKRFAWKSIATCWYSENCPKSMGDFTTAHSWLIFHLFHYRTPCNVILAPLSLVLFFVQGKFIISNNLILACSINERQNYTRIQMRCTNFKWKWFMTRKKRKEKRSEVIVEFSVFKLQCGYE